MWIAQEMALESMLKIGSVAAQLRKFDTKQPEFSYLPVLLPAFLTRAEDKWK